VIAFPSTAWPAIPKVIDLMWQAMELGADLVGGMAARRARHGRRRAPDRDCVRDRQHYDVDIDMHIDETDDPYWHSLEVLAEQTIAHGYQGRVTAGHCCAMAPGITQWRHGSSTR